MPKSNDQLLRELRAGLAVLRRRHRELSWMNVSQLDQLVHQTARPLSVKSIRTERLALERDIFRLIRQIQGAYFFRNPRSQLPDWLKLGRLRISGETKEAYFVAFFTRLKKHPELTGIFAKLNKQPWRQCEQWHFRWRILLKREIKARADLPAAVARLRRLLAVVRGSVELLK